MKIALLGCGVVGGGVLDIIDKRCDMELNTFSCAGQSPNSATVP